MTLFVISVAANMAEAESSRDLPTILVSYSGITVPYGQLCMSLAETSSNYAAGGMTIGRTSSKFTRSLVRLVGRVVAVATSIEGDGPLLRVLS